MTADILPFRRREPKLPPHPEYEAWTAAREKARREFEIEQLRQAPKDWSNEWRPTSQPKMDLHVDWTHKIVFPIPLIVGVITFALGVTVGLALNLASAILQ